MDEAFSEHLHRAGGALDGVLLQPVPACRGVGLCLASLISRVRLVSAVWGEVW